MRLPLEVFPSVQAAATDRADQVVRILLIGLGVTAGLVAFVFLAHALATVYGWMVEKPWPVAVYTIAAVAVTIGGYVGESPLFYYGLCALLLPVLLLMLLGILGF